MATPVYKNPVGRPRTYRTPEEMQPKIDDYFATCDLLGEIYSVVGLALHLGFEHRQAIPEYAQYYPEFTDTLARARSRIEKQQLNYISHPDTKNANGIKFNLTNNFGYRERQEIDHTTGGDKIGRQIDLSKLSPAEIDVLRKIAYVNDDRAATDCAQ